MATILSPTIDNFERVSAVLNAGNLVAIPTETVYGLAANAMDNLAVSKIFETKDRPSFDPLIVHIGFETFDAKNHSLQEFSEKTSLIRFDQIPKKLILPLEKLIKTFWPGPMTLVLPKSDQISDLVSGGLPTVGLRVPAHPIAQGILNQTKLFLAAPSANRFGKISPTNANAVQSELGERIDWILNGGQCKKGLESTVIGIESDDSLVILRPGSLEFEEAEEALKEFSDISLKRSSSVKKIRAPGQVSKHYAPKQDCRLLPKSMKNMMNDNQFVSDLKSIDQKIGILFCKKPSVDMKEMIADLVEDEVYYRALSEHGDPKEAASNLFVRLREIEDSPVSVVFFEPWEDQRGLGYAIQDRLNRASKK